MLRSLDEKYNVEKAKTRHNRGDVFSKRNITYLSYFFYLNFPLYRRVYKVLIDD